MGRRHGRAKAVFHTPQAVLRRPSDGATGANIDINISKETGLDRFIIISGCSGGGKSTLLEELALRGFSVIEEPGRRIVAAELAGNGAALPWRDIAAFLRKAIALSEDDLKRAATLPGPVFFDRGLLDAASGLSEISGEPPLTQFAEKWRFNPLVFLTPPWPEIYRQDAERQHGFEAAIAEYERLRRDYPLLGYELVELPKISVAERADFVLAALARRRA